MGSAWTRQRVETLSHAKAQPGKPARRKTRDRKGLQMQQLETRAALDRTDGEEVEAALHTLASPGNTSESLAEVAHDARNMVTALGLYCDLLEAPGVLAAPFEHYGNELKMVAAASRRLVEKLASLKSREHPATANSQGNAIERAAFPWMEEIPSQAWTGKRWDLPPATTIGDLAEELRSNRNLLAALAGPSIEVLVDIERGELPVRLTGEDLTRMLVNLVKNSIEAMTSGGRIRLVLRESLPEPGADPWLTLNVEDNGPGIPRQALESIFEPGYTTRSRADIANGRGGWRSEHRGLGLSITRSIVEAAGGRIQAANRDPSGACFQIELPVGTLPAAAEPLPETSGN